MPSLSTLIQGKRTSLVNLTESNLERGLIMVFHPGYQYEAYRCGWCWKPCGTGCAIIEVWGASGSGGRMCCCGIGLPGNPGAYSRRTICVTTSQYICSTGSSSFQWGMSCGEGNALFFRGCSNPTGVCWFSTTTNGCMCAEGGRGGQIYCTNAGASPFTCLESNGFCRTSIGAGGCGIVCNFTAGTFWMPQAYGGDINCPGGISCMFIGSCDPAAVCCHRFYVRTSPYRFGVNGGVAEVNLQCNSCHAAYAGGQAFGPFYQALAALSHSPAGGTPYMGGTYNSNTPCGCYEAWGCIHRLPTGVPGLSALVCPDVRDSGMRGGNGAVRITFFCTL